MKKIFALAFVLVMLFALCASAAMKDFPLVKIKIDVPDGWTVNENKEIKQIFIATPDGNTGLIFQVAPLNGATVEQAAKAVCDQMKGKDFTNQGTSFTFVADVEGTVTNVVILSDNTDDKIFGMLMLMGDMDVLGPVVDSIQDLK